MTTTDNEDWGRTMFTLNQEKIHKTILDFMDERGQGGCPAFSPEYMLEQLRPSFKSQGLRVGAYTLQQILAKSNAIAYDFEVTGTAYRNPTAAKVEYKFESDEGIDIIKSTIGGLGIEEGEDTLYDVPVTGSFELPIEVEYTGIGGWRLHITNIEMPNGSERKLKNDSYMSGKVNITGNIKLSVKDVSEFDDIVVTIRK